MKKWLYYLWSYYTDDDVVVAEAGSQILGEPFSKNVDTATIKITIIVVVTRLSTPQILLCAYNSSTVVVKTGTQLCVSKNIDTSGKLRKIK